MQVRRTRNGATPFGVLCAVVCIFILALTVRTRCAFAQGDATTVRVGYYENEVFQEGAEDGAVKTGYAYEYYRKLSEYTGWSYEYVYGDFAGLYQMLLDGDIDLLAGLAWREERAELISYPDATMGSESYYLLKHDVDLGITSDVATLAGKRIGVLDSAMVAILEQFLTEHDVAAEVITYPDPAQLFDAFDAQDLDVFVAESDGAYGREHAEVLYAIGSTDYFLCVSKDRPDLLATLNAAQRDLSAAEPHFLSSLGAKYYSVSVSVRAFSQSEREWIGTHDSLRVGYLEDYLPYSATADDGQVTGLVKDIVPEFLKRLGLTDLKVTFSGYKSYDAMVQDVGTDTIDIAFPVGGGLYYSEENGIYQSSAVASALTEIVFRGTFDEDTTSHVGVNENNRMQYYYVRTHYPDADITLYPSIGDCLQAVIAGEVGCTTLNGLRANDILRNSAYKDLSMRQSVQTDDRCFGVKIGNEGLLKLVNRGINTLGSDYAQAISYRYTAGLYSYTAQDFLREHMAIVVCCVMGVSGLLVFLLVRDWRRTKQEVREKEKAELELKAKNEELAVSREALSDALVAAEHANHAKTIFLNNMSHDIRTPMNAIVGFTALAASHIDNRDQALDYLGRISVSSQHLLSLINDVLDMSRIESGKVTIEEADVHLPDVIHDLVTIIQSNANDKQLELLVDTQDVVHEEIVTDKLRLNQVLLNILSNAIKFTPNGGTISFRVIEKPATSADRAVFAFCIKDNGIGMSDQFQETIFEPFSREKTSTVSGIQGTGLGMAITKNIVDMMGGTIEVQSEQGKGSEFIVSLPFKISETTVEVDQVPELVGLRVLVVDDDTNVRLSICAMLRELGMRADWTAFGREAVIRAKEALDQADEYGVYLIDWMMPDRNVIESAREIRRIAGDSAPIIILTTYEWADIEQEAREAGVTGFCPRPLFISELKTLLSGQFLAKEEPRGESSERNLDGRRVLLAEDNEMNQMIAVAILEEHGLCVEVASDGQEALSMVEAAPAGYFDIILMDVQMPQMDGYEATRRIRALADPRKAAIPIVAVTANAFEEDRVTALSVGMNGHLAKPYDVPSIMEMLHELIL